MRRLILESLCLAVVGRRVLFEDLLTSHSEALEEKVGLHCSDHVFFFFGDQIASFHLEVLFVLALALLYVVAERLLLDAGADHLLLILCKLLIRHRRLGLGAIVINIAVVTIVVFLEVLSVSERGSSIEIGMKGALHVGEFALHR